MLRLLDRIIPTPTSTKNAVDKKKGQARQLSSDSSNANAPSSFSQFLPEYKCSLRHTVAVDLLTAVAADALSDCGGL